MPRGGAQRRLEGGRGGKMSEKFRGLGEEVYIDAAKVKESKNAL